MKRAPVFDCTSCGQHIGKTRTHYQLDDDSIVCVRCLGSKPLHAKLRPDCPHGWHDLQDHLTRCGTRAGVAHVLGLWP